MPHTYMHAYMCACIQCIKLCISRPVKVVRLVTRHSVEEIVLRRATAKLKMTSTVIEGGQVSNHSHTA